MSDSNRHLGGAPANEPPRPQVRYNLAALRLAQSSNEEQSSHIHVVSTAPPSTTAPVAPQGSRPTTAFNTAAGNGSRGAAPSQSKGIASPTSSAALLAALHIGEDRTPAAHRTTPSQPAPRSLASSSPSAAAPAMPSSVSSQYSGSGTPTPFSTAVPLQRATAMPPSAGPTYSQAVVRAAPMSGGGLPVAQQLQQLQQLQQARMPLPQAVAEPSLVAPQSRPEQVMRPTYPGAAFVNPFQQSPVPTQASQGLAVPRSQATPPASTFPAGRPPAIPQPQSQTSPAARVAYTPPANAPNSAIAPGVQQQQQQQYQSQQQMSSAIPAPRTRRDGGVVAGTAAMAPNTSSGLAPGLPSTAALPSTYNPATQLPPPHQQLQPGPYPQPRNGVPARPGMPQEAPAAQQPAQRVLPTSESPNSWAAGMQPPFAPPQQQMQQPFAVPPPGARFSSPAFTAAPPVAPTNAAGPSSAVEGLYIQALQRMGIPAHAATTRPSTSMPVAAATTAISTNTAAGSVPLSQGAWQQQQQQQRQQQQQQQHGPEGRLQQAGPNFYANAGGRGAPRRPYNPQYQPQQHHDPQSRQPQRQMYGRGGSQAGPTNAQHAPRPPPPAAVSHLADPDPETLRRFTDEYSRQEDADHVSDELRAQKLTQLGTVGTLDEGVCLSLIESHDVTFVVTDTGTGKSTRIPMALHRAHPDALIVNAQPRRTAAISLAQRVAEMLGVKLGEGVGYSVRGEHIGELGDTKVMYVTTYSLFIYFLWHEFKEKLPFTYIIVDEFHERTPDVEVILLMLKLWLKKHPKAFKLILCSATAQVEEWHTFFDGLNVGTYSRSPVMYPVREYFIEDLQKLVGFRTAPIAPQEDNNMVSSLQMHQILLVCKQLLEYLAKNTAIQDSVLVFMPGRTQVELMTTWMRDNLEVSLEPIAWYRDIELSVIQEAFARPAVTRKKVYVATDIAEVSLTLPDVVFVIDSGTGKRPQISPQEPTSYAFPPLRLLWESSSNAQQRRGRVGRVQQGFYLCLLGKDHHAELQATESRIKNAILTELVLHSLLITHKPFAFFQLCNERPERGALSHSLHLLQDGGLIIGKDDPLAEAERLTLDHHHTNHVMNSPWKTLLDEALTEVTPASAVAPPPPPPPPATQKPATAALAEAIQAPQPASTEGNERRIGDEKTDIEFDESKMEDVEVPEAEDSAFNQWYYMTLRGIIAARSPVSVAAATNIFYGLLCGTPTLCMLAAAIESCKSPFHVPYTINDRAERAGMVRAVSQMMQRYHGSLQSDLICAMEVTLEYMSMQRDGLSEEAQEEWCQARSVSRTRIVDTLNLFAQMKEQVSSVLPFPDVTDIDVLTAQFEQNAEMLVLLLVASHTELAIQVQLDGPVAQARGFVGHGVFFPLKCLKDESVPTVCPWDRTKISVPLSLQTIHRKVLAVFSSQVETDLFALVVLIFSFRLRYTVLDKDATPSYLMAVSHSGVQRTFQCDVLTAQQILQLRRIQCAQLRCMQLQVEQHLKANESEKLSAALKSANSDFGLPASAMESPYLIPTVLQHGLRLLVNRLRSSVAFTAFKQTITEFPPGTAFCKLQPGAKLTVPIFQSVLIHSSNGLSLVTPATPPPAAAPVPTAAVQATAASAAAAAPAAAAATAVAVEEEIGAMESDVDDEISEKSSEDHVATFRYDL